MEYIESDFENMFLNVRKVKVGDNLLTAFPILKKYEEFSVKLKNLNKGLVIRYIAFAFDKHSPLTSIIDIMERRKEEIEEHTSELQSHSFISYAVFCLKKKNKKKH